MKANKKSKAAKKSSVLQKVQELCKAVLKAVKGVVKTVKRELKALVASVESTANKLASAGKVSAPPTRELTKKELAYLKKPRKKSQKKNKSK